MTVEKFLDLQMVQNDIPSKMALSKMTGIDYQRLNKRLKAPLSMTLSELDALSDTLNLNEESFMDFIRTLGIYLRTGRTTRTSRRGKESTKT